MTNNAQNPALRVVFTTAKGVNLYAPATGTEYHLSRYVAAGAQDIFSASGATKEVTAKIYGEIKRICEESHRAKNLAGFMDVNTLLDNLLYRHQYPVDELCAVRMGAIMCFLEVEPPDQVAEHFTREKMLLAVGDFERGISADPDLYAFFLTMGVEYTPSYAALLATSIDLESLTHRAGTLRTLIPPPSPIG